MTTPTHSTSPASALHPEAPPTPAQPPPQPLRRRGLFWVAVLASLVALVGGGLVTVQAWRSESAPETSVVDYFDALARGDAAAALALGDVPPGVPTTYLTREVLQASLEIAKISNVRVLAVERAGRTATVTLQYQLDYPNGPSTVTDAVRTVRQGRNWRLRNAAAPVHLRVVSGRARMSIAGAWVPEHEVLFFAGALPVRLDTEYLDLGQQVVHLHGTVPSKLQPRVSPAGRQAVTAAIAAMVTSCARGPASPQCPPPDDARVRLVPRSLHGKVSSSHLEIAADPDKNGRLHVTGTVTVTGSYQELDFDNQPGRKSGPLKLTIDAQCYAKDPIKLTSESAA
jgi:hypothetical protein